MRSLDNMQYFRTFWILVPYVEVVFTPLAKPTEPPCILVEIVALHCESRRFHALDVNIFGGDFCFDFSPIKSFLHHPAPPRRGGDCGPHAHRLPRTDVIMRKGAVFTSSFEEESQAMLAAANWIQENCDHRSRALILTDCQSVCRALQGAGHEIDHLRMALEALPIEVTIQFVDTAA